jgi:hypothetical protein
VKAFSRKLCFAFVTMGMLSVTGCGPDNEAEGKKLSTKLGDPGKADLKDAPAEPAAQPKSNADRTNMTKPQGSSLNMGKDKNKPAPKK